MSSDPGVMLSDMTVTPLELGKLQRELFAMDDFLSASKHGSALPYTSLALQRLLKAEGVDLLKPDERARFVKQLQFVRRTAPIVQMSFASEPSKQALRVLVRWFRENGHPNTLISVGVQPTLAGGCIVRTSSKTFDFSLQQIFKKSRPALAKNLV